MSKILKLHQRIAVVVDGSSAYVGAGTDVNEIEIPDKIYGITGNDVNRMVASGAASIGVVAADVVEPKQRNNSAEKQ